MEFALTHLLGQVVIKKDPLYTALTRDIENLWFAGYYKHNARTLKLKHQAALYSLKNKSQSLTSTPHSEQWKRIEWSNKSSFFFLTTCPQVLSHHLLGIISPQNRLGKTTWRKVLPLIKELNTLNTAIPLI